MTADLTPQSPFRSPEQREADRAAKRHALLLAAARMFNARGFHAASLDDVATSVGVTKPTIYHYLGNKEQVLIECMAIGLHRLREAASQSREVPGTARDRLRRFLERYAEVNMTDFGQCVVRTGDELLSCEGLEKLRALKRPIDAAMRQFIREGIDDGSIAPCDPKLMAFALAGAVNWIPRWYDDDGALSRHEIAEQIATILDRMFGR